MKTTYGYTLSLTVNETLKKNLDAEEKKTYNMLDLVEERHLGGKETWQKKHTEGGGKGLDN